MENRSPKTQSGRRGVWQFALQQTSRRASFDHVIGDGQYLWRHLVASDSIPGPWKPRPIKAQLFTSPTHDPSVDDLARASKGDLRFAPFSMHRDDDLTLATLFMLVSVKAAAVLG
jgi:hypothetical protein